MTSGSHSLTPGLVAAWEREWSGEHRGWDFSDVAGAMDEDETPWDFDALSFAALSDSGDALDLGTGGGEQLIRLLTRLGDRRPAGVTATEGWAPNVPVARAALAPWRVPVLEYDAHAGAPMPVPDHSLDLVLARHEAYDPAELLRVLRPGGVFLTQQVGSRDAEQTATWFGRGPRSPWARADAVATLEEVGLRVVDGAEHRGCYRFSDVRALLRYLSHVPWDLPGDFTVTAHLDALARLQAETDAGRALTMTRDRWWLRAVRP